MKVTTHLTVIGAMFLTGLLVLPLPAQFDSGSNEEDGALNITTNTVLDLQEDGVHNYTTINVASGATLTFNRNNRNTPVIFLASGDVTIAGTINVRGADGLSDGSITNAQPGNEAQPGPGGYPGGLGGVPVANGGTGIGTSGGGPGGGQAADDPSPNPDNLGRAGNGGSHFSQGGQGDGNPNPPPPTYGDRQLLTLSGGSGGAGGNMYTTGVSSRRGQAGGAGGGAILIASSTSITVGGTINADGGNGHGGFSDGAGGGSRGSGGGAGGAIRLISNVINVSGNLYARGGGGRVGGGRGAIWLEAIDLNVTVDSSPPFSTRLPSIVTFEEAEIPTIEIVSIAGEAVPDPPAGSTATPDVIIPDTTENPVEILIQTENVPDGAVVNLRIVLTNGETLLATSSPVSSGAASASVELPATVGVIYATADFDP